MDSQRQTNKKVKFQKSDILMPFAKRDCRMKVDQKELGKAAMDA